MIGPWSDAESLTDKYTSSGQAFPQRTGRSVRTSSVTFTIAVDVDAPIIATDLPRLRRFTRGTATSHEPFNSLLPNVHMVSATIHLVR